MSDILEIKELSVGYVREILPKINLSIKQGEMVALMGKNGCGKSTLLKTISGLLPALSGEIEVLSQGITDLKERARNIAVVLTERPDLKRLSVYDILLMARYPHSTSLLENKSIIKNSANLLSINNLLEKEYSLLSDGQKQIVLLCRALVQDTKIIILDEPFTFLDIPRKLEVMHFFKKIIREKGISILFSTHDWELVYSMNLKILLVDESEIILGKAKDLLAHGDIKRKFGHSEYSIDDKTGQFILNY